MDLYREARVPTRPRFGGSRAPAESYFRRYVEFVARYAAREARLLDVGCGIGWSTLLLRDRGFDTIGVDVHDDDLEVEIPYRRASVQHLPFETGSVGTVGMHQVLEHVSDPEAALVECGRILRPGGRLVVVVGPNLLSFPLATTSLVRNAVSWRRGPDLPRHPYGNTLPEAAAATARAAVETVRGLVTAEPRLVRREPDPRPPFHADNDAAWFANPITILRLGRRHGLEPLWWAPDRRLARIWWPLAAGTWVVLERRGESAR